MARLIPGRIMDGALLDAKTEAAAIVAEAQAEAEQLRAEASRDAASVRESARERGEQEGRARAAAVLAQAEQARTRLLEEAEGGLVKLALAAAKHVLRDVLSEDRGRMEARVHQLLDEAKRTQVVRVRLSPQDAEQSSLTNAYADPELTPGDVIVEAASGRFDARIETQLDALERAMTDDT